MLLLTGKAGEVPGLDAMVQLYGLGIGTGRNEVEPAPGDVHLGQSEDGVGNFIAAMMVIEQPGIEILLAQCLLNRVQVHKEILYRAGGVGN